MKFIVPKYDVLPIPNCDSGPEVLKHIERIGRVCYKSEDKITDTSAVRFIANLRERKHWAMLEHFIFVMSVPKEIYLDIENASQIAEVDDYQFHNHIKYIDATEWKDAPNKDYRYIVSGSATAFNYLWECKSLRKCAGLYAHGILQLCYFLAITYPDLMKNPYDDQLICPEGVKFLSRNEIESLPFGLRCIHDSMSVTFVCSRGTSHDLVRHRPASWAMESTRWINYLKKGSLNFVIPVWFDEDDHEWLLDEQFVERAACLIDSDTRISTPLNDDTLKFLVQCRHVENIYNDFISTYHYRPEQAREMLPHTTKTELTMTARLGEWRHFFKMRAANDVAPQVKEIIVPLFHQMLEEKSEIFGDMKWVIDWEVKNNG